MNDLAVKVPEIAFAIPSQVVWALVIIGAIGVFAWLRGMWRSVTATATPTPSGAPSGLPAPDEPIVASVMPAPRFMGFRTDKQIYDFGERIILNTGPEDHGDRSSCSAQSHGIVDNGSGPYLVRVRAYVTATRQQIPVYVPETGEECTGAWVTTDKNPNGKMGFRQVILYALGKKPWAHTGSLENCDVFVPINVEVRPEGQIIAPQSCGRTPCAGADGVQPVKVAGVVSITLEETTKNRFGVESEPHTQQILAATSPCGG